MLKLKKLKISNVGRFVGDHEISFEGRPYLMQVDAENLNTGGSSGAGKSTVFNSLEYLLGINHLPSTVLQSRLTKSAMSVSGIFDLNGEELVVERAKTGGLSISLSGAVLTSGNNKMAEEKLDEILGISRDLLRKMIHKRQKEGGFFLSFTAKECHAFLAEALDLKTWTSRLHKAVSDHSSYSKEYETTKAAMEASKASLDLSRQGLESLVEPKLSFSTEVIPILKKNVGFAQKDLFEKEEMLRSELRLISRPSRPDTLDKSSVFPFENNIKELRAQESFERKQTMDKISVAQKELRDLEEKLSSYKHAVSMVSSYEKNLDQIKIKILSLKSNTCHTCSQPWHQSDNELSSLVEKAKSEAVKIQSAKSLGLELPSLELAIQEKKQTNENLKALSENPTLIATIRQAEAALTAEQDRLDKTYAAMMQSHLNDLETCKSKENEIRTKFSSLLQNCTYNVNEHERLLFEKETQLKSYESELSLFNQNRTKLSDNVKKQEEQFRILQAGNKESETMMAVTGESVKIIKSYMNTLFQGALDSIASKASTILSRIPNMSTCTVYFEGFKETKAGTIKDEINAILTMDGEIDIPVKSMSGGERTAIDLAVDLAVIDMIEERAGKGLDLFVLDEPFDGLDSVCREQCLEILKTHVSGKRIILVDHSNETKELVHDRIVVIRDGQTSSISGSLS